MEPMGLERITRAAPAAHKTSPESPVRSGPGGTRALGSDIPCADIMAFVNPVQPASKHSKCEKV